jgi:hypothetical protein
MIFKIWKKAHQQRDTTVYGRAREDQAVHVTLENGRPIADGKLCLSFEGLFE